MAKLMLFEAAAAVGGIATAAYLNGKYQLVKELNYIRKLKRGEREYQRRRKRLPFSR
jgi:hypothetical protein